MSMTIDCPQVFIGPLSRKNIMDVDCLEKWLCLDNGATITDVVKIIESRYFNGLELKNLTELVILYLEKEIFVLFSVFLKRFRYKSEAPMLSEYNDLHPILSSVPLSRLLFYLCHETFLNDEKYDNFFKILLKTQAKALIPAEYHYFYYWICRSSDSSTVSWRYLKYYFEIVNSDSMNEELVKILVKTNGQAPISSRKFIEFILNLPNFDVNTRISFFGNHPDIKSPLLHILATKPEFLDFFLPLVLEDSKLDIGALSGQIPIFFKGTEIIYTNCSILFLAYVLGNFKTFKFLCSNSRYLNYQKSNNAMIALFKNFFYAIIVHEYLHFKNIFESMILYFIQKKEKDA